MKNEFLCWIVIFAHGLECRELYEFSRRKPGWRFTAGLEYRLPGHRTIDFWNFIDHSFCLRISCSPSWHLNVSWNVLIVFIGRLLKIEKVDRWYRFREFSFFTSKQTCPSSLIFFELLRKNEGLEYSFWWTFFKNSNF